MNDFLLAILTGLSIGFLGSFHCIGMCGPLALALPVHKYTGAQKYLGIFLYNFGRAITYGILGLVFGFLGSQFRLWGLQQAVSIGAGLLILLFIFSSLSVSEKIPVLSSLNKWVQAQLGKFITASNNPASLLSIGLLNGLLPCGLVYVAIAGAGATMNTGQGIALMFAFGIGTIPTMAGLMIFGHLISQRTRRTINKLVPYVVGMMAVILILRGMNLGIPFISPKMDHTSENVELCH